MSRDPLFFHITKNFPDSSPDQQGTGHQTEKESCETEPIRGLAENRAGGLLFVGRDVVVPKDLQGEKYIIFDMNGKVLESGLAGVRIKRHAYPVILKIKGRIHYLR